MLAHWDAIFLSLCACPVAVQPLSSSSPVANHSNSLILQGLLQRLPREPLEDFLVPITRSPQHILRHLHALFPLEPVLREPVAQELLIEALLVAAGLVLILGPHARRVRRQHLVDEHDLVRLLVQPELELGVGDDDAARGRVLLARAEHAQRQLLDARGVLFADDLRGALARDVLVVLAQRRLGAGRVDGAAGDGGALRQARRQRRPVHGAVGLVLLPRAARHVPAHDGLQREHLQPAHLHAAVAQQRRLGRRHGRRHRRAQEVRLKPGHLLREHAEPVRRLQRQQRALVRHAVLHHHVVRGDAVRGHEEQGPVIHVVQVAHFALRELGQRRQLDFRQDLVRSHLRPFSLIILPVLNFSRFVRKYGVQVDLGLKL